MLQARFPVIFIAIGLLLVSCATSRRKSETTVRTSSPAAESTTLKVALFPWIPDSADDGFESLRNRLEARFESENPGVDLVLRLEKYDDSYYNPAKLAGWLAAGKYDLVEIDTVILGDLIDADVIAAWPTQDEARYFPAGVRGSTTVDDQGVSTWWGIPHLLCGYFVVSKSAEIDNATTISALADAVKKAGKPLLGNFDSSWDLPSLYLDSRVDNGLNPANVKDAIDPPLDGSTANALDQLAALCQSGSENPCIDGTYSNDYDGPVNRFVDGQASGFWGYSERLHLTVRKLREKGLPTDDLLVTSVPLGYEVTPLMFTDAFVRRTGCSQDRSCSRLSSIFVEFINGDWAVGEVLLSRDAAAVGVESPPRYLLPAARSGFDIEGIKTDRLFSELKPFGESGFALPNAGELYQKRRTLQWLLNRDLSN